MNDQISANFPELDDFLKAFAMNISRAKQKGIIQDDFLTTTRCNYEYLTHSRIHALIAKAGFDLDYVVEIEAGFKIKQGGQPKTDVQLWKSDELMFLIEYESTNSSDSGIIWRDIQRYDMSRQNDLDKNYPKYWVVIYTLPNHSVRDWTSHDYNKRDYAFERMTRNPHKFYKSGFNDPSYLSKLEAPKCCPKIAEYPSISEYTESENWESRKIFLINLTVNGLEIDFPERFNKNYNFEATTE